MINIDFEKFSSFYSSKIEPLLFDLEKERRKAYRDFILKNIIFFMVFVFQIFIILILNYLRDFIKNDDVMVFISVFGLTIIPCLVFVVAGYVEYEAIQRKKHIIRTLKTKIYKILFDFIGLKYSKSASPEFADYQNTVLKYIPEGRILSKDKSINIKLSACFMKFEDGITGTFKDIPFELCDATIIKRYENKYHDERTIFQGLMLAVKLNKSIKTETIIKSDNFKNFKINKEIISLEDNEFNKKFKVLADDEVESRYLLTTSFMERLKNFHKSKKDKTIIFFDNSCSESKNMFILTNTGKDNFEIPFNKSILNEKYYYNLLKELVDMLEIAVALKLEQNIGL